MMTCAAHYLDGRPCRRPAIIAGYCIDHYHREVLHDTRHHNGADY